MVVRLLSLVAVLFTVTFISLQSQANGLQRTLGSQISVKPSRSAFALIANGKPAPLVYWQESMRRNIVEFTITLQGMVKLKVLHD